MWEVTTRGSLAPRLPMGWGLPNLGASGSATLGVVALSHLPPEPSLFREGRGALGRDEGAQMCTCPCGDPAAVRQ